MGQGPPWAGCTPEQGRASAGVGSAFPTPPRPHPSVGIDSLCSSGGWFQADFHVATVSLNQESPFSPTLQIGLSNWARVTQPEAELWL